MTAEPRRSIAISKRTHEHKMKMWLCEFKDVLTAKSPNKSGEACWRLTGLTQPRLLFVSTLSWNRIKMSSVLLSESTKREINVVERKWKLPIFISTQTRLGSSRWRLCFWLFVFASLVSLSMRTWYLWHTPNDWLHSKCCKNNFLEVCLTWNLTCFRVHLGARWEIQDTKPFPPPVS